MTLTLQEIAAMSDGLLVGNAETTITGAASVAEAMPGEITFYRDPKYLAAFRKTRAAAAFVPVDFEETVVAAQIRVSNPAKAFEQIVLKLAPLPITRAQGITLLRSLRMTRSLEKKFLWAPTLSWKAVQESATALTSEQTVISAMNRSLARIASSIPML